MFQPVRIADFLIEKDELFARHTLDPDEYTLYLNTYKHLTIDAPTPSLVIYLQAPTEVLLKRIRKRGILSEQFIELGYLENLNTAYTELFHYYKKSPLLIVNSAEIDLVDNEEDYRQLVEYILSHPVGTNYFNPRRTV
jgi:deoxyadenosine/deoxycytidine kinase